MYDTCNRHILVLVPQRILLFFLFDGHQTVGSRLSVHGDTVAVILTILIFCRFVSGNLGIVRSSRELGLLFLVVSLLVEFLSAFLGLFPGFLLGIFRSVFLGRFHGEFLSLDFFLGHFYLAVEAEAVSVTQEDMLVVISVPVLLQYGRDFIAGEIIGILFRMLDIVIIGDTSVLGHLLVIGTEEEVCLISVAQIRGPHGVLEVGSTLCIVVSSAVFVVETESTTQLLVGIHCKDSLEVVFSVGTVTTTVQRHVGDRRVGVGEMEVAHGRYDVVVWFREHEVTLRTSVDEDTVDSCSTHVAQCVILSI